MTDKIAPTGIVMIQVRTISRIVPKLIAPIPLAKPTPSTAPTTTCVVEIGIPNLDANNTVMHDPKPAANPLEGVSWVIFLPTVSMTLHPQVASPKTIAPPPKSKR